MVKVHRLYCDGVYTQSCEHIQVALALNSSQTLQQHLLETSFLYSLNSKYKLENNNLAF